MQNWSENFSLRELKDSGSFSVINLEFMENLQYNMGVSNETVNARKTKSLKNISHNVGLSSVLRWKLFI